MKPWTILGRTRMPDGAELTLTRHDSEFAILIDGRSLMSSRTHGSEEALAVLGCEHARTKATPCVLIGGLGMGYTLRAALDVLPATATVVVAELAPAVVEWNRGPLGPLANHPMNDPRVRIEEADVAVTMRSNPAAFDAVLLDVDNGPVAMADSSNASLYGSRGVAMSRASLTPDGVLAVWCAADDRGYERQLRRGGFSVVRRRVRTRRQRTGLKHTIILARNGVLPAPSEMSRMTTPVSATLKVKT